MLIDLYEHPSMWWLPFKLLEEREPEQNISHKGMPTWQQHCEYIQSRPHPAWYLFESRVGQMAGCVYLSHQREIGIGVLKSHRGNGLASKAIKALMEKHRGPWLANINPKNSASARLFNRLGFEFVQVTYRKD